MVGIMGAAKSIASSFDLAVGNGYLVLCPVQVLVEAFKLGVK